MLSRLNVHILGVPMYAGTLTDVSIHIVEQCRLDEKKNLLVSATGAHGLVYAEKEKSFKDILRNFYLNLPDGKPSVWVGRLKGTKKMERCYGPVFFQLMMEATCTSEINHYLCGGKNGVADELKEVCHKIFGNSHTVGTFTPPFREMSDHELHILASDIVIKKADIVWIGLSTPKQEVFASRLAKITNVSFICTVGAAFDFHTGRIKQAPQWIQDVGMEWFFRLLMEPRRLWKRYFNIVPLFIWYNIIEIITGKFFINQGKNK
jgi:N-acetylglucosaminyldiphosphoundecaprenol N-acetyl-beta-D-mannosaminyltransferase